MHGPQPRSYEYAFPRKKLLGALRSAMQSKLTESRLTVVDSLSLPEAKTKLYRQALSKLEAGKTTLLVETSRQLEENLYLGSRNLEGVELVLSSEVHPYDLLRYEHAIFSREAFAAVQDMLLKNASRREATGNQEVA